MKNATVLFCDVDDFCQIFMPVWTKFLLLEDKPRRNRCFVTSRSNDDVNITRKDSDTSGKTKLNRNEE